MQCCGSPAPRVPLVLTPLTCELPPPADFFGSPLLVRAQLAAAEGSSLGRTCGERTGRSASDSPSARAYTHR